MRQILLIAALIAALVAAALGFDFIHSSDLPHEQVRLAVGWGFWSAALVITAGLVGDR